MHIHQWYRWVRNHWSTEMYPQVRFPSIQGTYRLLRSATRSCCGVGFAMVWGRRRQVAGCGMMWVKQCHKPPIYQFGNGKHTTYTWYGGWALFSPQKKMLDENIFRKTNETKWVCLKMDRIGLNQMACHNFPIFPWSFGRACAPFTRTEKFCLHLGILWVH